MSDWFLNNLIICAKCQKKVWFSPEGYVVCECNNLQFKKITAKDVEVAFIDAINDKILNDDAFIEKILEYTNIALNGKKVLTKKEVAELLLDQYKKIFNSADYKIKRQLATTLVKNIKIYSEDNFELELEYNDF